MPQLKAVFDQWMQKPTRTDAFILCLFVLLITWHPFYLHQQINLFELGLYLPGIDGILNGQIPYRDFFYLRGPVDLYLPALFMRFWGEHVAVLCAYFYAGTVMTLIICVIIARELLPSRIFFYMLVPVLVARTFPRVVFTYWGGLRYAWGLLAVLCVIYFLRGRKIGWLAAAGIFTAIAGLTSIEIGVCAFTAATVVLLWDGGWRRYLSAYCAAILTVVGSYFIYMAANGALADYLNTQWVIVTQMTKTFVQTEPVPANLFQILHALLIPNDKNFRQMTSVYCYLFLVMYLFLRRRSHQLDWMDKAAAAAAVYGFMVYVTGFRNLWASVFEMSLQPEKIILFYMLSRLIEFWGHVPGTRTKIVHVPGIRYVSPKWVYVLMAGIIISSLGYSISRFNKRFLFFRKDPLKGQEVQRMDLPRLKNMVIPLEQAQDLSMLNDFLHQHTTAQEPVLMYPEMGAVHFIVDRPYIGRFASATMAWMSPQWHSQWFAQVRQARPRYAVVPKKIPDYFETSYFPVEANRRHFRETMGFIEANYIPVSQTPSWIILQVKEIR